jgi:hypothetical protein
MSETPPQLFFKQFVRRSFEEFRAKPEDEYLAKTAVMHANVMAERMWHAYKDTEPARVYSAVSASRYRDELTAKECDEFGLIRDVADGFKHLKLTQRPQTRRVSSAAQTGAKDVKWANAEGEEITWTNDMGEPITWRSAILVELDDGTSLPLMPALASVVAMWERLCST